MVSHIKSSHKRIAEMDFLKEIIRTSPDCVISLEVVNLSGECPYLMAKGNDNYILYASRRFKTFY